MDNDMAGPESPETRLVRALHRRFPRLACCWGIMRGWTVVRGARMDVSGVSVVFRSSRAVLLSGCFLEFTGHDPGGAMGDGWEQWERQFDQP